MVSIPGDYMARKCTRCNSSSKLFWSRGWRFPKRFS
jgi:hypothetical protein